MTRIFYAWELGGGLGHVAGFAPVARALEARGCEITWALAEPGLAAVLLEGRPLLAAPRYQEQVLGLPEPQLAYSEVLMRHGYLSPQALIALIGEWRDMMRERAPDLVITDHAPTALLAARSLGLPCARFGTGFCCPPARDPEVPLLPGQPPEAARRAEAARVVLGNVNLALATWGVAPLADWSQLHAADADLLTTYPELDHYPGRQADYCGAVLGEGGVAPQWPQAPGPRVLFYIGPGLNATVPLLRALRRKHCAVLAYCPEMDPRARAEAEGPGTYFSDRPFAIEAAAAGSDLVVCGAGHGTVCAALLAGKPLLMVPRVTEQAITMRHVEQLGAGLGTPASADVRAGAVLARLFAEPGFARAAGAFRARHGGRSQAEIVDTIALRCLALASARAH